MSRKKPSGGELQTAANRQAILPAQANPKEKINEWLYQEYRAVYQKVGKVPDARHNDSIVLTAYRKIEEAGIWIPMGEVEKYFFSRKNAFRKCYEKELARTELLAEAKEV